MGTAAPGDWAAWALGFVAEAAAALAAREPDEIDAAERDAVAGERAGDMGGPPGAVALNWREVDEWLRGAKA